MIFEIAKRARYGCATIIKIKKIDGEYAVAPKDTAITKLAERNLLTLGVLCVIHKLKILIRSRMFASFESLSYRCHFLCSGGC